MTELTYFIYEDSNGPCFACKRCMYHSRNKANITRRYCQNCVAYHTDDGHMLGRNVHAERGYRAAWRQRCLAFTDHSRHVAERCMDELQEAIGRNPTDPRYYWFVRSLPGFLEHWDDIAKHYGCESTRH